MKALIIAAGKGSRIKSLTKNEPKPLIQLLGLFLIERVILTAKQSGTNEFIIVVGHLGEKIKKKLGNGDRYGVKITYIENMEWEKGNGVSVLKAKELLNGKFILLMADHIFEPKILSELKRIRLDNNECALAVDKMLKRHIGLDEATKVKIENGYIVDIGKKIDNYNGIDCGIFLLSPAIFEALEESIKNGNETLSGGIRVLAKKEKIKAFDIKENFWIDIDTKDNYRKAEKILCKRLIKPTDGPISKLLNRQISIRISKLLLKTKIKPNLISFMSFIIGMLSVFFFCLGNYLHIIIGGLLAQFSSIIDGCDGEIARLKSQESSYGAWFDAVLDRYVDALIIFGMAYGYWNLHHNIGIWIVSFIALIGSFMNSYTADKYDNVFKKKFKIRVGRDIRLFLIMIGALFNQIFYTLIILGILTNVESIKRLYILKNDTL
ncbi:NTP transferase domain-containing protein [candidate division WOR-3 bacterium]|nr:NTP transferase domain-containing protein [candidate division WOR-3 bacterium]